MAFDRAQSLDAMDIDETSTVPDSPMNVKLPASTKTPPMTNLRLPSARSYAPTADAMDIDDGDYPSPMSSSSSTVSADELDEDDDLELTDVAAPAVILFDWDDTLLPSSFLAERGHRLDNDLPMSVELQQQLAQHEQAVILVLETAARYGTVNIVTNAETGWVELSAQKFLPRVAPLLRRFHILSARSTYEPSFPGMPVQWKYQAFRQRLAAYGVGKVQGPTNVVSFGDSHVEREAIRAVTRDMSVRTKSVKFAERPSVEQLRRQIELVTNCFEYIQTHDADLDLMLTISLMY